MRNKLHKIMIGTGKNPQLKIIIKENDQGKVIIHYYDKTLLPEGKHIADGTEGRWKYNDMDAVIHSVWQRVLRRISVEVLKNSFHPIFQMFAEKEKFFRDWRDKYPEDPTCDYKDFEYLDMFLADDLKKAVKEKYKKLCDNKNGNI